MSDVDENGILDRIGDAAATTPFVIIDLKGTATLEIPYPYQGPRKIVVAMGDMMSRKELHARGRFSAIPVSGSEDQGFACLHRGR